MARVKKQQVEVKKVSETEKLMQMDVTTIEKNIAELKQSLFNLRFQAAVGKLEKTSEISKTKKQIARMKTVLTQRANNEAKAQ